LTRGKELAMKEELECRKLEAEIKNLEMPAWRRPSAVFGGATAIAALIAVYVQAQLSHGEYTRADTKLTLAQIKEAEIQKEVDEKTKELTKKTEKLSELEAHIQKLETRYDFVDSRMEDAIVLLARVKNKLPKELKEEVEAFEFPKNQSTKVSGYEKYFEGTENAEYYKILYETPNGNYFIWTWSSQDSSYGGAIFGKWITKSEAKKFISEHGDL